MIKVSSLEGFQLSDVIHESMVVAGSGKDDQTCTSNDNIIKLVLDIKCVIYLQVIWTHAAPLYNDLKNICTKRSQKNT